MALAGESGENCDGHPFEPVGSALRQAVPFLESLPNVTTLLWNMEDTYQALLHHHNSPLPQLKAFWQAVREDNRHKIFVGPSRLYGVVDLLRAAAWIEIPELNAFSQYASIRDNLLANCTPDCLVVLCAGMPAKVWIADVLRSFPQATCIDAGSSFDALLYTTTRTGQIHQWDLEPLYSEFAPKVNAIVFTMDRAMQLDAHLRSMKKFAPHLYPPTVMVRTTYPESEIAYSKLKGDFADVTWTGQADFKNDLLRQIDSGRPLTALLCDDSVFYRRLPQWLSVPPNTCYSMRFEKQTGYCITPSYTGMGGYCVEGNVHRTQEYREAIRSVEFTNPSKLEEALNWSGKAVPVRERFGFERCLVSIPHNKVQTDFPENPSMGGSAAELNERYLTGERIDLDAMDFSNVIDAHQFIQYKFKLAQ